MDEFEQIFNSIYAEQHPDEADDVSPVVSEESSAGKHEDAGAGNSVNAEAFPDSIYAAYDKHRPPISSSYVDMDELDEKMRSNTPVDEVSDESSALDENISDTDVEFDEGFDIDIDDINPKFSTKSFGAYISSRIAGLVISIRGGVPPESTTSTGEEDIDELGPEMALLPASKYYGSYIYSLKLRVRFVLFFLVFLAYISLGLPVPGALNNAKIATTMCLIIQLSVIVFSLDVFTNGILNIFRGRFGADSLAAISCIVTTLDGVMVISETVDSHLPLCIISSFTLFGVLFASLLTCRAIRKSLRVPGIADKKLKFTITGEIGVTGNEITLLKSKRKIEGFLRRTEEEPIDENTFRKIAPIIVIAAAVLTVVITYFTKSYADLLFIFSVIFCTSVPAAALLCYSLPYFMNSLRIFSSGAAIAGWSGATDIGHSKNLIVTDRDLFPSSNISIENVRIFANFDSDKVIAYACSMILHSKCCLDTAFMQLKEENECPLCKIDNFEVLSGGGFKGMIEGKTVICGCPNLMRLLNIKIPSKLVDNTCVLLSIDDVLYGIFNIKYKPDAKVRRALVYLMGSNRHAIFATRDFNITPDMIHDYYDVATDGYDFPPYADRFPLSEARPAEDSKIAGVTCREGLGPLIALADSGRSLFVIANINTIITVIYSFVSLLLTSGILFFGKSASIPVLSLIHLAGFVPVLIIGIIGKSNI